MMLGPKIETSNCFTLTVHHLHLDIWLVTTLASLNPRHHLPSGAAPAVALLLLLLPHRKQLRFEEIRTITTELPWPVTAARGPV